MSQKATDPRNRLFVDLETPTRSGNLSHGSVQLWTMIEALGYVILRRFLSLTAEEADQRVSHARSRPANFHTRIYPEQEVVYRERKMVSQPMNESDCLALVEIYLRGVDEGESRIHLRLREDYRLGHESAAAMVYVQCREGKLAIRSQASSNPDQDGEANKMKRMPQSFYWTLLDALAFECMRELFYYPVNRLSKALNKDERTVKFLLSNLQSNGFTFGSQTLRLHHQTTRTYIMTFADVQRIVKEFGGLASTSRKQQLQVTIESAPNSADDLIPSHIAALQVYFEVEAHRRSEAYDNPMVNQISIQGSHATSGTIHDDRNRREGSLGSSPDRDVPTVSFVPLRAGAVVDASSRQVSHQLVFQRIQEAWNVLDIIKFTLLNDYLHKSADVMSKALNTRLEDIRALQRSSSIDLAICSWPGRKIIYNGQAGWTTTMRINDVRCMLKRFMSEMGATQKVQACFHQKGYGSEDAALMIYCETYPKVKHLLSQPNQGKLTSPDLAPPATKSALESKAEAREVDPQGQIPVDTTPLFCPVSPEGLRAGNGPEIPGLPHSGLHQSDRPLQPKAPLSGSQKRPHEALRSNPQDTSNAHVNRPVKNWSTLNKIQRLSRQEPAPDFSALELIATTTKTNKPPGRFLKPKESNTVAQQTTADVITQVEPMEIDVPTANEHDAAQEIEAIRPSVSDPQRVIQPRSPSLEASFDKSATERGPSIQQGVPERPAAPRPVSTAPQSPYPNSYIVQATDRQPGMERAISTPPLSGVVDQDPSNLAAKVPTFENENMLNSDLELDIPPVKEVDNRHQDVTLPVAQSLAIPQPEYVDITDFVLSDSDDDDDDDDDKDEVNDKRLPAVKEEPKSREMSESNASVSGAPAIEPANGLSSGPTDDELVYRNSPLCLPERDFQTAGLGIPTTLGTHEPRETLQEAHLFAISKIMTIPDRTRRQPLIDKYIRLKSVPVLPSHFHSHHDEEGDDDHDHDKGSRDQVARNLHIDVVHTVTTLIRSLAAHSVPRDRGMALLRRYLHLLRRDPGDRRDDDGDDDDDDEVGTIISLDRDGLELTRQYLELL